MFSERTAAKRAVPFALILAGVAILALSCSPTGQPVVLHQVTGPIGTNCYLLYDATSKEAALIDVGGPVDSLLTFMEENDLLFAPVRRPAEMYDDPHVNRPGGLFTSHYAEKKDFRAPPLPIEADGKPVVADAVDLPSIGQHNSEILGALKREAVE